jgi:hypothetical protein
VQRSGQAQQRRRRWQQRTSVAAPAALDDHVAGRLVAQQPACPLGAQLQQRGAQPALGRPQQLPAPLRGVLLAEPQHPLAALASGAVCSLLLAIACCSCCWCCCCCLLLLALASLLLGLAAAEEVVIVAVANIYIKGSRGLVRQVVLQGRAGRGGFERQQRVRARACVRARGAAGASGKGRRKRCAA